jgi:RHS repeat-associated protein
MRFQEVATSSETLYFVHTDHLGTPQAITEGSQQLVWQADYEPFGGVSETVSTIENAIRFPGQYADAESGLHYNYFRTYDPSIGRYTQSDPIGLLGGLNTYAYVTNHPTVASDPLGLAKVGVGGTGSFFVGGAGGSVTATAGVDTDLNFCVTVTVCGRLGGGASTGVRYAVSAGEGTFCTGDTGSLGFFAGGGLGPFASVSTRTDADLNTTVTGSLGVGGGVSGGGQVCNTKTICF